MFLINHPNPTIKFYIATDLDGSTHIFWTRPTRKQSLGWWGVEKNDVLQCLAVSPEKFPNIEFPTWHDEPLPVEIDLTQAILTLKP